MTLRVKNTMKNIITYTMTMLSALRLSFRNFHFDLLSSLWSPPQGMLSIYASKKPERNGEITVKNQRTPLRNVSIPIMNLYAMITATASKK